MFVYLFAPESRMKDRLSQNSKNDHKKQQLGEYHTSSYLSYSLSCKNLSLQLKMFLNKEMFSHYQCKYLALTVSSNIYDR